GDALLSAMDMLAAGDPAAIPTSEMPADVVGDMPR
ncbi:TPA: disulfide bond formation protein DsbA, partial [Pseudomonas aeruginosa]|nr:disulfide bond formation protein DsbA [Pseudomonas aeruginosa]